MQRTEHNEEKFTFPFVEYVPQNFDGRLPLIVMLHGAGERGNGGGELALVDVHGFSKVIKDQEISCRFVMPQCPKNTFWAARVESILEFISQLKECYNTDENRIYLTGFSMGGFGTWFTAMASPHTFAAIAPVCSGGMDWNADVLNMPIWAFHGDSDKVVNPIYSDLMVAALERLNKNVKYTKLEGVGHNAWDYAYNKELIDWLLSKSK